MTDTFEVRLALFDEGHDWFMDETYHIRAENLRQAMADAVARAKASHRAGTKVVVDTWRVLCGA